MEVPKIKNIFILNGSRRKRGNTANFSKLITNSLSKDEFEIEYGHPQDFIIKPCVGCHQCFVKANCSTSDDMSLLKEKILKADVFIIASPVYLHYMTADLKLMLEKIAYWAHMFRLQGKPVVVLSTCSSNGHETVIKPLSHLMKMMGGNVIAAVNAAQVPNQLDNKEWLQEICQEVAKRIQKYADLPAQSTPVLDGIFKNSKVAILEQEKTSLDYGITAGEVEYWKESGMLEFETFTDYLESKTKEIASHAIK